MRLWCPHSTNDIFLNHWADKSNCHPFCHFVSLVSGIKMIKLYSHLSLILLRLHEENESLLVRTNSPRLQFYKSQQDKMINYSKSIDLIRNVQGVYRKHCMDAPVGKACVYFFTSGNFCYHSPHTISVLLIWPRKS